MAPSTGANEVVAPMSISVEKLFAELLACLAAEGWPEMSSEGLCDPIAAAAKGGPPYCEDSEVGMLEADRAEELVCA